MNTKNPILFVADTMLGKLAKYLRVMGYDTFYQTGYPDQRLSELVKEGRILLTRNHATATQYSNSVFIDHDLVKDQLKAVDNSLKLTRDRKEWFSRCIVCNSLLSKAELEVAQQNVPDFVFFTYHERIVFCPICKRFYWPGTHRERMVERLKKWGY
ncbi:MAG: hypothetical protein JRF06_00400 [Deltaproteobacteria bacterium]|nr:hypothetical protein [Deltaproteobacteria bacterium]